MQIPELKLSDIKVPGVLWVLLIIVGVILAESYGAEPRLVELGIFLLFMVAKSVNVGDSDVQTLLDILRRYTSATPRSMATTARALDLDKHAPNRVTRWLLG